MATPMRSASSRRTSTLRSSVRPGKCGSRCHSPTSRPQGATGTGRLADRRGPGSPRRATGLPALFDQGVYRVADATYPTVPSVYIGDGRILVRTIWGFHVYADARELSITPQLALNGAFELPLARWLMNHVRQGEVTVDVGANIGLFSVFMGHLVGDGGRVYSYEPVPETYELLQDNVESNWLDGLGTVRRYAVRLRA